jgi:hypothetical protein
MFTPKVSCAVCGHAWAVEELRTDRAETLVWGMGCERCGGDSPWQHREPLREAWAASVTARLARVEELAREDGWSVLVQDEHGQTIDGGGFGSRDQAFRYGFDRRWPASGRDRRAWVIHREDGQLVSSEEVLPGLHEVPPA